MRRHAVTIARRSSQARQRKAASSEAESNSVEKTAPLAGGIGQDLVLFGRRFHVQTESCDGGLRTEIFLGGRLITTRRAQLSSAERLGGAESQRLRMKEYHQSIVSGIIERASSRHESKKSSTSSSAPRGRKRRASREVLDTATPEQTSLQVSLRVRDLITDFRRRIATIDGATASEYLEQAYPAIAQVIDSPLFKAVRLDEQLRFHLLQDQIDAWRHERDDHHVAAEIWSDITDFSAQLEGINHRAEFAAIPPDGLTTGTSDKVLGRGRESTESSTVDREETWASLSPQPGSPQSRKMGSLKENIMARANLEPLAAIDGFIGATIVDSDSGMMLGAHGGGPVNLELAAAGNTQVVRAKRKTMESLKLNDQIEDILISLGKQYHLIRPLESNASIFLYLVLDRGRANLAMARHELKSFEGSLNLG